MKPEAQFQKDLAIAAAVCGCLLIDIPDPVPSAKLRFNNREKKRPFDCVLVTPDKVYCLELKCQYGKQMPHQKLTEQLIGSVNPCAYYVVTKRRLKEGLFFIIKGIGGVDLRASDEIEVVRIFNLFNKKSPSSIRGR